MPIIEPSSRIEYGHEMQHKIVISYSMDEASIWEYRQRLPSSEPWYKVVVVIMRSEQMYAILQLVERVRQHYSMWYRGLPLPRPSRTPARQPARKYSTRQPFTFR
jgi:hypothetical protein